MSSLHRDYRVRYGSLLRHPPSCELHPLRFEQGFAFPEGRSRSVHYWFHERVAWSDLLYSLVGHAISLDVPATTTLRANHLGQVFESGFKNQPNGFDFGLAVGVVYFLCHCYFYGFSERPRFVFASTTDSLELSVDSSWLTTHFAFFWIVGFDLWVVKYCLLFLPCVHCAFSTCFCNLNICIC